MSNQRLTDAELEAMRGHTPGPWHVGGEHGAEQLRPSIRILRDVTHVEGVRPTTYVIGSVTYPTTRGDTVGAEERRANARLIAAATALLQEVIERRAADAKVRELVEALTELYAAVRGECPSLLNEDSGGNARLDLKIADALAPYRTTP